MFIKQFEDIEAWKCSRAFVKKVYIITNTLEFRQDFNLKDQLRRASVSVMLNIAEGFDSKSRQSFIIFLRYSFRSTSEIKSILYLSLDLNYITAEQFDELMEELIKIQRLISGFINSLSS